MNGRGILKLEMPQAGISLVEKSPTRNFGAQKYMQVFM
jgi:hypothetical protein